VLIGEARLAEVILRNTRPNLDVAPANRALAGAQSSWSICRTASTRLRMALEEVRAEYDLS
jgi:hypothetical protein